MPLNAEIDKKTPKKMNWNRFSTCQWEALEGIITAIIDSKCTIFNFILKELS